MRSRSGSYRASLRVTIRVAWPKGQGQSLPLSLGCNSSSRFFHVPEVPQNAFASQQNSVTYILLFEASLLSSDASGAGQIWRTNELLDKTTKMLDVSRY
ncbi:hypothetical protein [Moorena sp. SIO4G3]|uniref:hypothetical protein n=1 Tax=Moorena sp. SIO4G3 TaxID=2607821 RepID=UPI0025F4CD1B|nr:hypothetical protein [Moorena sp. SIO4G3]